MSLDADPDRFPFQLSSHSISVPVKEGDPSRYSFQAIVVETPTQLASTIREKFYELDHPAKAQAIYPYTGMYHFVPLLKSKEWPMDKIYKLARLHVNLIKSLRPMYVNNLQDINHVIDEEGNSLMQGFMACRYLLHNVTKQRA
jgi:hypothetical protein